MKAIIFIILFSILIFSNLSYADSLTLSLQQGWNMFSLPLNTTLTAYYVQSHCSLTNSIWNYNPVSGAYDMTSQIKPGIGYWLKVDSACSVPVSGSSIQSIPDLKTGWNQIGTFSQTVVFNDVKGTCNVISGPWKYNSASGQYELATSLYPGYGYWIKVESDCRIAKKCSDGTMVGICSPTRPKYCDNEAVLVDRCNICNCPTGYQCKSDYSCGLLPVCSDGTISGQCSSNNPKYCDNGNLINKCSACGCPFGYSCQSDGSCKYSPPSTCDSTCKAQNFASGSCKSGSSSPVGMLHVCGTKLCDENNNEIVLRGTQYDWNAMGKHDDASPTGAWFNFSDVQRIKSNGGTVLELHMMPISKMMPTKGVANVSWFNERLDKYVSWCEQTKLYCIISLPSIELNYAPIPSWLLNGETANQASIDFWNTSDTSFESNRQAVIQLFQFIADRYKNNKTVIFGLINEPFMGNSLVNGNNAAQLSVSYARLIERIIDTIRTTGAQQPIFVDKPYVWFSTDSSHYEPVNRNNIVWEDHAYVTVGGSYPTSFNSWKGYLNSYVQRYVYTFNKPFYLGEYGVLEYSSAIGSNTEWDRTPYWKENLTNEVNFLKTLPLAGYAWHEYPSLDGEWYDWYYTTQGYDYFTPQESDWILQTVFGSSTSGSCQSGETSIGQDGCSSGTCCCSGTTPSTCDSTCKSQGFTSGSCEAGTSNTNLAVIPNDWGDYNGNIIYDGGTQITFLDYNVVRTPGKPSMRLEPHTTNDKNNAREVDGKWYGVSAGDVIHFGCWMKTDQVPAGYTPSPTWSGARVSFDYYDTAYIPLRDADLGQLIGWGTQNSYVPYGSDWSWREATVTVPASLIDNSGATRHPSSMVLWVQVWDEYAGTIPNTNAWFADCELYINPTSGGSCQSGETSIGQDGCSSGTCCCSGTTPSTCDSTCKAQNFASGICKSGGPSQGLLPSPTQFSLISNPRDSTYHNYFHTHNTLITMFKTLFDKYPGYASYEPIGKTSEGRDIVLFKIGNPNGGKVLWDGSLHGWEDAGSEVEYLISKWLLENGTTGIDQTAKRIIDRNLILFVPVINMDSYERQNRDFASCSYGTDLNRNFVTGWGSNACADYPNAYHGSSAASEKETQAMRSVFQNYKPDFYLNAHYGGGQYMQSASSTSVESNLIQTIKQISSERGVTPYSMSTGSGGGNGMAYGDAKSLGQSSSWYIEINNDNLYANGASRPTTCSCYSHTCDTYQDVVNVIYPRMLPILIGMAESSEVIPTTTTSTCQTGESSIGPDGCLSGTCCCSGTVTPTLKILRQSFQNWQWSAQKFASLIDVFQAHYDALDQAQAIKAIRPDVLTFVYRNTETVWGPGNTWEYNATQLQLFKNNNWILKDASGNYIIDEGGSGYFVDIGNPDYHTWLANWYKHYIDTYGLDGASLDNWFCESVNVFWSVKSGQTPINPRTGAAWTDQNVLDAGRNMVQKIRQVIGSKLILVNGVANGNHFYNQGKTAYYQQALTTSSIDAVMSEDWVSNYDATDWVPESLWLDSINFAIWMENNFPGKYFMQISADSSFFDSNQLPSDMTQAQYDAFATFSYASRLLTVKRLISIISFGNYIEQSYPQSLFKIDTGSPLGDYYMISGTHVYARDFSKIKVLVNPSTSSYTVNVGSGYKTLDGQTVSSITMSPHTGEILLKSTTTCTSCSSWTSGSCGAGGCSSNQRQQTRTCTPSGCTPSDGLGTSRCVADTTCGSTAQFQININPNSVIGKNNFSLGFMTDWSWPGFISDNARRQLVKDANFKIVRVFDFRTTSPKIMPCANWDTVKNNCTSWDWTQVDSYTQTVFGIGAEPMFTLGWPSSDLATTMSRIPNGMPINSTTGLPNAGSYAVYAAEWIKHFKQKGWPVRYYEIMNEPFAYFGWNPSNNLKLTYFVDFWNTVARAMRQQNPNILLSQDALTQTNVLTYWLQHGDNVDYLDFHKYDCGVWNKSDPAYYSDSKLFGLAESSRFESTSSTYGVKESQQKWLNSRGKLLPVINSESNLNSAWEGGTDPRIQQMTGAVWKALELRQGILEGVSYSVYYEYSSNANSDQSKPSKGYGFGMINSYNNTPWYPYYVQKWIGNNLYVGDNLVQSTSSSNNIRTLSWINNGKLNIFLIHNSTKSETASLQGVTGTFNYQKIDDPTGTSYLNPALQTGTINAGSTITLNGYTVMLLQQTTSNQCTSCVAWTNGACGAGGCSSNQRQQTRTCSPTGCTPTDGLGTSQCVADSTCGTTAQFQVNVDMSKTIGTNKLQIGTHIDFGNSALFVSSSTFRNTMQVTNIQVVRAFLDNIGYSNGYATQPCRSWNDITKTGTFNWTDLDKWVNAVFNIGATPLIVIGYAGSNPGITHMPSGMGVNATTLLPNPDNYAAYSKAIVQHFIDTGKPVIYYEVVNEPFAYFGWNPDATKLVYFMTLYNASYNAMKSINGNLSIAFDFDNQYSIMQYEIAHNVPIDRIDYHKYDTGTLNKSIPLPYGYKNDSYLFMQAERDDFVNGYPYAQSVQNAASWYKNQTGRSIPIWNTESNVNSAWDGGTDTRMVQMNGTVWDALKTRTEILDGVSVDIHFTASGDSSYEQSKTPYGGYGFGMTDSHNNFKPWYPYWFYQMVFNNLKVGDKLYSSSSSSSNLRTLAWIDGSTNNLLIIHNSTTTDTIQVTGFSGTLKYSKIDNSISFLNSAIQTGTIDASSVITLNGYTIILLQTTSTVTTCSDGTVYGQCSSTKPKYCSSGALIDKCSQCGCLSGTCQTDGTCTAITTGMSTGINYISAGNDWYDSDSQLDADFGRFAKDGIKYVSIRVMWSRLEPKYNSTACILNTTSLNNVKRVLQAAQRNGISVKLDFWTHFQDVHWDMPPYIASIFDILPTNSTGYNLWIRYVKTVVSQLKGYSSIDSWSILNEPFYSTTSQKAPMEQLIRDEVAALKTVDNTRPITCRFTLSYSPSTGKFDSSIYDVFDIFTLNEYLDPSNPSDTKYSSNWGEWDKTISDLKARNKPLWISEFGDDNTDTEHVRLYYENSLKKFDSTGIVQRAYAWVWQTRSASSAPFNIYDGTNPKPAYYELTNYSGAPQQGIEVKGIQWFYNSGTNTYSSSAATQALNDLNSTIPHFNYVYLDVWVNASRTDNITVVRDGKDSQYISAIQKARALGKKVVIRIRHRPSPYDFQPANTDLWLKNFTKAVVDWASFSQQYGVEMFSIVNEFNKWDGDAYSSYWNSLISQVRNVYSGKVIANINNWDKSQSQFNQKYSATWLNNLDYIAVSAYWDLCSSGGGTTVDQLVNSWQPYVAGLKNISDTHGKKIIIITGLSSASNTTVPTCVAPWDGDPTHWQQPDLTAQDNWYEAVFRTFNDKPWIYGYMFDTAWFTYQISSPTTNKEGTVQGKPAAATIEKWFGGTLINTCSDGTAYGQCSSTKPKYCSSGTLIDKCSQCGCLSGTCQTDGTCAGVSYPTYSPPPIPSNVWAEWRDRATKENLWKNLWNAHGLGSKIHVAGTSVQGRNIYLFEAGNPNAPALFVDAEIHGNEDHSDEILLMFAYWLLNGEDTGNATAQRIMQKNRILFIPILDTDMSDKYSTGTFKRNNANAVNLNRNFEYNWASSTDAEKGPSAASEPETQTVKSVFTTYKPRVYMNLHTGAFMAQAYGNSSLSNAIIADAPTFSSYFHVGYSGTHGGLGFAVSDAVDDSPGVSSWLIEFFRQSTTDPEYDAWMHDSTNLNMDINRYYPKFQEFLISALSNIETP